MLLLFKIIRPYYNVTNVQKCLRKDLYEFRKMDTYPILKILAFTHFTRV